MGMGRTVLRAPRCTAVWQAPGRLLLPPGPCLGPDPPPWGLEMLLALGGLSRIIQPRGQLQDQQLNRIPLASDTKSMPSAPAGVAGRWAFDVPPRAGAGRLPAHWWCRANSSGPSAAESAWGHGCLAYHPLRAVLSCAEPALEACGSVSTLNVGSVVTAKSGQLRIDALGDPEALGRGILSQCHASYAFVQPI